MILLCSLALGADVTSLPPALRGDVSLGYTAIAGFGSIREGGERRAGQRSTSHGIDVDLAFAPIDGVAVTLGIEGVAASALHFVDATEMVLDPISGTGTYVGGKPLESTDLALRASGLRGVWLGAAVAPFSEAFHRGQHVTWRLDAAVRTPGRKHTFWTSTDGKRGVAPGGVGVRLAGAFSVRRGAVEPYLVAAYTFEGKAAVDVIDDDGAVAATGLVVDPSDHLDVRGGAELVLGEDPATGERFSLEAFWSFGYVGWQDLPSGVLLPGAVDRTAGEVASRPDRVRAGAGIGAIYAPIEQFGARVAVDGAWTSPSRIEHWYAATSGFDTVDVTVSVALTGRIR